MRPNSLIRRITRTHFFPNLQLEVRAVLSCIKAVGRSEYRIGEKPTRAEACVT